MKTLLSILMLGMVFAVPAAQAQQAALTAADIAQIKTDVKAAVVNYVTTFNKKDAKGIQQNVLSQPSFGVGPNGVTAYTEEQDVKRYVEMVASFEKTGWAKSEVSGATICVLNASVALSDTQITRFKADGSVLTKATTTYMLNKAKDGKWRIFTYTGHDAAKTVTCGD